MLEPPLLDLVERQAVAEVDDRQLDLVVRDVEQSQEAQEEPHHVGVRVDERERVARLRPFGPVEHAASLVKRLIDAGDHPAEVLCVDPRLSRIPAPGGVPGALPIRQRVPAADFEIPTSAAIAFSDQP